MMLRQAEISEESAADSTKTRQAFLLTLWYPKTKGGKPSFVTLQPSHCSESLQFEDLTDAFNYLKHLAKAEVS
jgi:hypothetical protein